MNKEIKFRIWDKSKNVFIPTEVYAIISRNEYGAWGIMTKDWENYKEGEYFYDHFQELQFFINLKDKNGTEIFTGDIVKRTAQMRNYSDADGEEVSIYEVIYIAPEVLPFAEISKYMDEYEVIGHIYDNQNLL